MTPCTAATRRRGFGITGEGATPAPPARTMLPGTTVGGRVSFVLLGAAIAVAGLVAAGEGSSARDVVLPIAGPQAELRLVTEHDHKGLRGVDHYPAGMPPESPLRRPRVVAPDRTSEGRF